MSNSLKEWGWAMRVTVDSPGTRDEQQSQGMGVGDEGDWLSGG